MGGLRDFLIDVGRNAYGLGENVASLGSAAIAEPVAGYAAMFDPVYGADAIREGMTYQPRTDAGQMYQQGAARTLGTIAKPAMPVIDTWQRGVDIAGGYSPMAGAALRTVPAAIGVAMGAKPALQAGRQVSNSLGAMQARMVANATAPRTLNTGYMGQRGAIGTQRPLTEFEQAHLLAQQRATLPVSQGGLGLAPDNTAMDRARAMGWDTDAYHGTRGDISAFDLSRHGQSYKRYDNPPPQVYAGVGDIGRDVASAYGTNGSVYPLMIKNHKMVDADMQANIPNYEALIDNVSNIRSRFAAFDPFNRDSSNLLAQSAKFAPAATLGALMANEKRKEKRN